MIVVDASALAVAISDDGGEGDAARDRLFEDPDLHAPHLVDIEVMSVLRVLHKAGHLESRRAALALDVLSEMPLIRYPHWPLAARIWQLRANLTPYDASYVALAEGLDCVLVTGDRRMARATGIQCEVEIL